MKKYNQPSLSPIPECGKYRLLERYQTNVLGHNITIPAGFSFDGASIPKIAWALISSPFQPRIMLPALIHDYIYTKKILPREKADEIFKHLLKQSGFEEWKINAMYRAVRWFGGGHYK